MPVRVYDLAKKNGLEIKFILDCAKDLNIVMAKTGSSSLYDRVAEQLEEYVFLKLRKTAEERVKEALESQAQSLSLNNLCLTKLPEGIDGLSELRILNLSDNRLDTLPEWTGDLAKLERLYLSNNKLTSIPKQIGRWAALRNLFLYGNQLKELPPELAELRDLQVLLVDHNLLNEIPEWIGGLRQLKQVSFSHNFLKTLPDSIGKLAQLEYLEVEANRLTNLPQSLRELPKLAFLYLHENPGLDLPPSILGPSTAQRASRGIVAAKPADILDYFFRNREGSRPLNEAKLILVGRGGVGKTCVIKRLLHGTFDPREKETPGIEIQPWEVVVPSRDQVRLHIWDFGGQEILHATHQFFLTERSLYLLVLSGREGKAMGDAEYWLQLIRSFGGDSKVIIVLNKSKQHPFDINRGYLLEKYPFIAGFVATDCADGLGVTELDQLIRAQVDTMEHRKTDFPKDWFAIKERLAGMRENFVTWEQYQDICSTLGEKNPGDQHRLAWFLNVLGIALNYHDDPRLKDTHVLNPRWVTEGIYPLLRKGQQTDRQGVLEIKHLAEVLDERQYPPDKYEFLVGLMQKFKLCFPLPERPGKAKQWLVPELLGENQPDIKAVLDEPGLGFRYQYEVLPEGLLPRFIVQTHLHSEANPEWRWRTGVVLTWDNCRAVVRADYRERRVNIHVTGPEKRRRELLAVIREKFNEQHVDLKGMKIDERVVIPDEPEVTVSFKDLLKREADHEEEFRPENALHSVSVSVLLNGVESEQTRAKRRDGDGTSKHFEIVVQPGAHVQFIEAKHMEHISGNKTTNYNVAQNYGQIGETLNNCSNVINQQQEGDLKKALDKLLGEVAEMLAKLPGDKVEVKQEAARDLKILVDEVATGNPARKYYSLSAKGLLEASKFVKDFTGNIAGTIGQLGKLIWPDFTIGTGDQKE